MLGESRDDIKRDLAPRSPRHIVKDDGKPKVGDRHEVAVEPFRVRLVVVGRHLEARIGTAGGYRGFRERDRLGRGIGARTGDDLALPRRKLNRLLDDLVVFIVREGRRLSARSYRADSFDARRCLAFHKRAERAVVNGTVAGERCYESCNRT